MSHPEFDFNKPTRPVLVHEPHARASDPETSQQAVKASNWGYVAQIVLETIESFGAAGCTSADVLKALPHIGYGSVTPMYKILLKNNVIQDAGITRLAPSGRQQRIMVATKYT